MPTRRRIGKSSGLTCQKQLWWLRDRESPSRLGFRVGDQLPIKKVQGLILVAAIVGYLRATLG